MYGNASGVQQAIAIHFICFFFLWYFSDFSVRNSDHHQVL